MAHLRSLRDPKTIHPLELRGEEFVVGRRPECDLVIDEPSISRKHAAFTFDGRDYYIQDLEARNFTYLNGVKLDPKGPPQKLKDDDQVAFCDLELYVFRTTDPKGGILFVDDDVESSNSTIMSKVGISSGYGAAAIDGQSGSEAERAVGDQSQSGPCLVAGRSSAAGAQQPVQDLRAGGPRVHCAEKRGRDLGSALVAGLAGGCDRDNSCQPHDCQQGAGDPGRNPVGRRDDGRGVQQGPEHRRFSHSVDDVCAPDRQSGQFDGCLADRHGQAKRSGFSRRTWKCCWQWPSQAGIAIDNAQMHESALRQRVIERDLELANEVQQGFLPESRPDVTGYEFFDFYRPANQVGGDYFDYLALPDGRIAVIVADVVGKGVAAALLMAKLSAETRYCLGSGENAAQAINMLNERLCRLHLDRFVTAVLVILDSERHEVSIANAGHMSPMLRTKDGKVLEPGSAEAGLPLGIMEGLGYAESTVRLVPGESLTMYTDGLNEAVNEAGEFYTIKRIRKQVRATQGVPSELGQAVVKDVCEFIGQGSQSDDMCLVTLGRLS